MAESSSSHLDHNVDDSYFLALHDDNDGIFPISDEKYAEELQLQEALVASSLSSSLKQPLMTSSSSSTQACQSSTTCSLSSSLKQPLMTSSSSSSQPPQLTSVCAICMDSKTPSEMFENKKICSHLFCTDCIHGYIAAKIKDSTTMIKCPDPNCTGVIGPQDCESMVPKQVLERWEEILCESLIMASEKFYCPFKDCSAMMVDDGGVAVTSSECPSCNRLFCAQCKVGWHGGMSCREFVERLNKGEVSGEDEMLMDLAKSKKWMRCSKCEFFVERVDGCKHITCRCGYEFCYGCGEAYKDTHVCAS